MLYMWKKLLSLLLVVTMLVSMMPTGVIAFAEDDAAAANAEEQVDNMLQQIEEKLEEMEAMLPEETEAAEEEELPQSDADAEGQDPPSEPTDEADPGTEEEESVQPMGEDDPKDGERSLMVAAQLFYQGERTSRGMEIQIDPSEFSYTAVTTEATLYWSDGSEDDLPVPEDDGHFEYLWLYSLCEYASGVDLNSFMPLSEEPEYWQSRINAYWNEGEGTDESFLPELLGINGGWTTSCQLPSSACVISSEADGEDENGEDFVGRSYACAVRWVSGADNEIIYGLSQDFIRLAPSGKTRGSAPGVLVEPEPLPDYVTSDDWHTWSNQITFWATASYGDAKISYQWYRASERDYTGEAIDGETRESFTTRGSAAGQSVYYYCEYSFINEDGELETHRTNVAKVYTTAASSFTASIAAGHLYGGVFPGGDESQYSHVDSYRQWLGDAAEGADPENVDIGYYYQSMEQTSFLSAKLSKDGLERLPHSNYMTVQWYKSAGPDYQDGGEPISEQYRITGLNSKDTAVELNRALIDCSVECPNDSAEPYYVTLVCVNYYTVDGTEYSYTSIDVGKVFTLERNEDLYRINGEGLLTNYIGHEDVMNFPETVGGITSVGMTDDWWRGVTTILVGTEKVVFPGTMKNVGCAFQNMVSLEEAVFEEGVETVAGSAFRGSNLKTMSLPVSLTEIGSYAFAATPLSGTLVFPASLTEIGAYAFQETCFSRIEFADNTFPVIGSYAFRDMPLLRTVKMPANATGRLNGEGTFMCCGQLRSVENYESILAPNIDDDFAGTAFRDIMNGVQTDGQFEFAEYTYEEELASGESYTCTGWSVRYVGDLTESLTIPSSYDGQDVIAVEGGAISNAEKEVLKTLRLPSTLVFLGNAFYNCKQLETVNFAELENLRQIAGGAFENCYRLQSKVVLNSFTTVGVEAFVKCYSITELRANGAMLYDDSFSYCFSLSVFDRNYRAGIAKYGMGYRYSNFNYTRLYTSKYEYYILSGNTENGPRLIVDENALIWYRTGNYVYDGTADDARYVLYMDPFTETIEFPGTQTHSDGTVWHIKTVGDSVLDNMLPETYEVTVGEGIENFNLKTGNTGNSNPALKIRKITFPTTLTTLRKNQFYNNSVLREVKLYGNIEVIPEQAFFQCTALELVDLSEASSLKTIGASCFYQCNALRKVILPEESNIETIGADAFYYDRKLTEVNLETLTELRDLGGSAFYYCDLRTVDLSNAKQLEGIPKLCFGNNHNLTVIRLPEDGVLYTVGQNAFQHGGVNAYYNYSGLHYDGAVTELILPSTLRTIGERAFYNCFCQNAEEEPAVLTLPDGIVRIDKEAFATSYLWRESDGAEFIGNFILSSPELPSALRSLGENGGGVFAYSAIRELSLPAGLETISDGAFRNMPRLEKVTFRDGLKSIGQAAFSNDIQHNWVHQTSSLAVLEGFEALTTLETIDWSAFKYQPLDGMDELVIPTGVKTIGGYAFYATATERFTIPAGVESIGESAFMSLNSDFPYELEKRVLTFRDPSAMRPEIGENLLHLNDDSPYVSENAAIPVTIRCLEDSAAYNWVMAHNENNPNNQYEIKILGAEPGLYLNLLMPDGSPAPAEVYESVCWTDGEGRQIGNDTYVEEFIEGETYSVRVTPAENYDWQYRFEEETVLLTAGRLGGSVTLRLFPREYFTVVFTVNTGTDDEVPTQATLTLCTDSGRTRVEILSKSADGEEYRFENQPMCDTTLLLENEERVSISLPAVQMAADAEGIADLGEIEMTAPVPRTSYPVRWFLRDEELIVGNDDFSYTLENRTSGETIAEAYVRSGTLYLPAEQIAKGDVLHLSAEPTEDRDWNMLYPTEAEASVCYVTEETPTFELRFEEKEHILCNFDNSFWSKIIVGIYDGNGDRIDIFTPQKTAADGMRYYIEAGTYTLVAMMKNQQMDPPDTLGAIEDWDITEQVLMLPVTVPALGHAEVRGIVPDWKNITLPDGLFANATITVRDWPSTFPAKLVEVSFSLPEQYQGIEKTLYIEIYDYKQYGATAEFLEDQGVAAVSLLEDDYRYHFYSQGTSLNRLSITTGESTASFSFLIGQPLEAAETRVRLSVNAQFSGFGSCPFGTLETRFSGISATRVASPTTKSTGTVIVSGTTYERCHAALYIDGEKVSEGDVRNGYDAILPYVFPRVSGTHRFEVRATDSAGNNAYQQVPYTVEYLATGGTGQEPSRLTIRMHNGAAHDSGNAQDQSLVIDLQDESRNVGSNLSFYYYPGVKINYDGTFKYECIYNFALEFPNPYVVDDESVVLYLYNADDAFAGSVDLHFNEENLCFEGQYVLAANVATINDRICGFALDYEEQGDSNVPSIFIGQQETEDLQQKWDDWHEEITDYVDGFRPISESEIENMFVGMEDRLGFPLPEQIKADIRNYFYRLNNITTPYYELYAGLSMGIGSTELASALETWAGSIQTEAMPAGVTPQTLEAQGAFRLEIDGEENCVYYLASDYWVDIYDFTTVSHCRIYNDNSQVVAMDIGIQDNSESEGGNSTLDTVLFALTLAENGLNTLSTYDTMTYDLALSKQKMEEAWLDLTYAYEASSWEALVEDAFTEAEISDKTLEEVLQDFNEDVQVALGEKKDKRLAATENLTEKYYEAVAEYQENAERILLTEENALAKSKKAMKSVESLESLGFERYATKISAMKEILWRGQGIIRTISHFTSNSTMLNLAGKGMSVLDLLSSLNELFESLDGWTSELNALEQDRQIAKNIRDRMLEASIDGKVTAQQYYACVDAYEELLSDLDDCEIALNVRFTGVIASTIASFIGAITLMFDEALPVFYVNLFLNGAVSWWKIGSVLADMKARSDVDEDWKKINGDANHAGACTIPKDPNSSSGSEEDPDGARYGSGGSDGDTDHRYGKKRFKSPTLVDPAGIVYEAVLSNVIEGATASVYYRGEDSSEVLWDAENYGQLNPQTTDAKGGYMWMTPEGRWKVRVEAEGYLPGDSEADPVAVEGWLPVLPPQIHVNIPMVSTASPTVESVAAGADAVTVIFSQYMDISQAETDAALITAEQNGTVIPLSLSWADAEESPTEAGALYGRVLKLMRADGIPLSGDGITVHIGGDFRNYAGSAIGADYDSEPLSVVQVPGSLEHSYPNRFVTDLGVETDLVVWVRDTVGKPMAGVTVTVRAGIGGTLSIPERAVSDENGRAVFPAKAITSGYDVLHFAVGTLLKLDMNTRVLPPAETGPEKPKAEYADGSRVKDYAVVEPGTEIFLSTGTTGAAIYYTTDDTCPCTESDARQVYNGKPIVIREDTFLRIAAWTEEGGYGQRLNLHLRVKPAEPSGIRIDREYLLLYAGDHDGIMGSNAADPVKLSVEGIDRYWMDQVKWRTEDGLANIVTVDEYTGEVRPVAEGTAFIRAYIIVGDREYAARCRVDVLAENPESETPVYDAVQVVGVSLPSTKAAVELYKTDYTHISLVLNLEQNGALTTAAANNELAETWTAPENTGVSIERAEFTDAEVRGLFLLKVADDRTLEIVPTEKALTDPAKSIKGSYKSPIQIWISEEGQEASFTTNEKAPLVLTVKKTLPNLKGSAVKLNSFIRDEQPLVFTGIGTAGVTVEQVSCPDWLTLNTEKQTVTYNGVLQAKKAQSGKLVLKASVEGYAVKKEVTVSVSASTTVPKLSFKPNKLSFNPNTGDKVSTAVTISPALYAGYPIRVTGVAENGTELGLNGPLACTVGNGVLTVGTGSRIDDSKKHTYQVRLEIGPMTGVNNGFEAKEFTVTVTTAARTDKLTPTLTVKAAGTLDTAIPKSPVKLTVSVKNYHQDAIRDYTVRIEKTRAADPKKGIEAFLEDITDSFETPERNGNILTLRAKYPAPEDPAKVIETGYTYNVYVKAVLGNGKESDEAKAVLKVKTSPEKNTKIQVKLTAKDSIDVIRPESAVTVTPKLTNVFGYTSEGHENDLIFYRGSGKTAERLGTLDGENAAEIPFTVTAAGDSFQIRLKENSGVNHKADKYSVGLSVKDVDGRQGQTAETAPTVLKLTMGSAKMTQNVNTVQLLKKDRRSYAVIDIGTNDMALTDIADVQIAKNEKGLFDLKPLGYGRYILSYTDNMTEKAMKNQTLKLQVYLRGNETGKPNATLSVKVVFA